MAQLYYSRNVVGYHIYIYMLLMLDWDCLCLCVWNCFFPSKCYEHCHCVISILRNTAFRAVSWASLSLRRLTNYLDIIQKLFKCTSREVQTYLHLLAYRLLSPNYRRLQIIIHTLTVRLFMFIIIPAFEFNYHVRPIE